MDILKLPASPKDVTGRDGFIVAKALYQAIAYQDTLKNDVRRYEWSDQQDMKAILMEHWPMFASIFAGQDVDAGRDVPDLSDEKVARSSPPLSGDR